MIFTRKVQVTQVRDGKTVNLAEFKGAIREIEVYPAATPSWKNARRDSAGGNLEAALDAFYASRGGMRRA